VAHKRVVRVISYEGIDSWIDEVLKKIRTHRTIFHGSGTIKELQRVELKDDEQLRIVTEKKTP
jgi:hypothetical protein